MATFDRAGPQLHLNRVSSDRPFNVHYACSELKRRGYQRIGLSLPESAVNALGGKWLGGFLASQHDLPEDQRIPLFVDSENQDSFDQYAEWHQQWRPDALLCLAGKEARWIEQMGLSPSSDVGVVCLNRPIGSGFSGMEENSLRVGEITCDVVVNQLMHNEQGLPNEPRHILVEGTWREGTVAPLLYKNISVKVS